MTDSIPALVESDVKQLSTVAAENIALALDAPKEHVAVIEGAIKDEINVLGTHFALALTDIKHTFEVEKAALEQNKWLSAVAAVGIFAVGVIAGYLLRG